MRIVTFSFEPPGKILPKGSTSNLSRSRGLRTLTLKVDGHRPKKQRRAALAPYREIKAAVFTLANLARCLFPQLGGLSLWWNRGCRTVQPPAFAHDARSDS